MNEKMIIPDCTSPKKWRSYLKTKYGEAHKENIAPRERVKISLKHEMPDRVPFDFWAVPEVKERLKNFFDVSSVEEVLRLLGADCRIVNPKYTGDAPEYDKDGNYRDRWGAVRQKVKNKSGGLYEEYAEYPLSGAETPGEINSWPGWPEADDWDFSVLPEIIAEINQETEYHIRLELGGIFEFSWGLYGLENFLIDLIESPELPCAIMDRYTALFIEMAERALDEAGDKVDMMYTFDDVGTQNNLLISKSMWRKYILPRHKKLNEVIKSYPVTLMYHSCGAVYPLIKEFRNEMGIDVLNPIQPEAAGMDMEKIKENFGDILSFHGGIDLQKTMPRGSPGEVGEEVRNRCKAIGKNGGYICSPAHHLQTDTPIKNIIALYTTNRKI